MVSATSRACMLCTRRPLKQRFFIELGRTFVPSAHTSRSSIIDHRSNSWCTSESGWSRNHCKRNQTSATGRRKDHIISKILLDTLGLHQDKLRPISILRWSGFFFFLPIPWLHSNHRNSLRPHGKNGTPHRISLFRCLSGG